MGRGTSPNPVFQDNDREMRERAVKRFINSQQRKLNFEEAYRVGAVLGKGGFGIVYAGVRTKDKREVAIKHVARNKVEHWANLNGKRVPLELKLLHSVQSVSGVIRLLDFFERPDSFIYVMEKPTNSKDLFDFIPEKGAIEEELAKNFFRQVTTTLIACHNKGVVHRDVKDENILVDMKTEICNAQLHFRRTISEDCQNLISSCLKIRPNDRIGLEQILDHPWMSTGTVLDMDKDLQITQGHKVQDAQAHSHTDSSCSKESI